MDLILKKRGVVRACVCACACVCVCVNPGIQDVDRPDIIRNH